jgi:steroid 5-alpha reductase family enzyme
MNDASWYLVSIAAAVGSGTMLVAWLIAKKINNAAVVDVAWPLAFAGVAVMAYLIGEGAVLRKTIICAMVLVWSLRLAIHHGMRLRRRHPREDSRYAVLREQYPRHVWLMFFALFQLEAVQLVLLSLPLAMAASNLQVSLSAWEVGGIALWLVAMGGETLADTTLERFRSKPENAGRVCERGLWRFSRHPNYFFEWLVWVAMFLFALGTPDGWITVYCPIIVLASLWGISGIAAIEAPMRRSFGPAYEAYRRGTSAFVPWFPRRKSEAR